MRGYVPRTHKKEKAASKVAPKDRRGIILLIIPVKNIIEVRNLINKILPYSAIKRKAKRAPPYSILNPETSSDSPSAKSKGARLVSARHVINQNTKIIGITIIAREPCDMCSKLNVFTAVQMQRMIIAIEIS